MAFTELEKILLKKAFGLLFSSFPHRKQKTKSNKKAINKYMMYANPSGNLSLAEKMGGAHKLHNGPTKKKTTSIENPFFCCSLILRMVIHYEYLYCLPQVFT